MFCLIVLVCFNEFCDGLLMMVVLFWVFLPWVVAATIVVVGANGSCFAFFAVGCGYHNGASGGERSWWLAEVPICGFLVVSVCVFFFFFFFVVVKGWGCEWWWWQWLWQWAVVVVVVGLLVVEEMRLRTKNNKILKK